MDWVTFFALFQSWGPSAISSVLVVVVVYLIKKVDQIGKSNAERSEQLQKVVDESIDGVRNQFSTRFQEHKHDIDRICSEHSRRLSYIEQEYTKNDMFLRELSGWKGEINRLSDQLTSQFMSFTQSIIQILTGGKS